jgi:hypothetical protein
MTRVLTEIGRLLLVLVIVNITNAVRNYPDLALLSVFLGIGFPGLVFYFGYIYYAILYHHSAPVVLAFISVFYNTVIFFLCEIIGIEEYPLINCALFSAILIIEIIKYLIKNEN